MPIKSGVYLITFVLMLGLMAACGPTATPAPTEPPPTEEPAAAPVSASDVVGITWQWAELTETEPAGQSVVADPENYTLALMPDGTANVKADCNRVSWPYTLEGNKLAFDALFATTLAACPPGSLYDQYLKLLGNGGIASLDNGRLVLELSNGAGRMVFDNGGPIEVAGQDSLPNTVTGTVVAEGNPTLPQGAMLEVRVEDVSLADAPATQVGGQIQEISSFPAAFEAPYNAELIDPQHTYGLTVRVTDATGSLLYINTQATNVLTRGFPSRDLEVLVEPVGGQPSGGIGIDPASISLDTMGLPYSWQANLVPSTPYDTSQPSGPMGLPEHIQINFGVTSPADRQPGDPVIYIIPVEAYLKMYQDNGDPSVASTVDMQLEMLFDPPEGLPKDGMPVLPLEEAVGYNDLAVQGNYLDSGMVRGLRFVGRFAQDANAVTNEGLRYILQGYAGEVSEYLIAFFYPVTTEALPSSMEEVPADEQASVTEDPEPYLDEKGEMLNGLTESDWEPDLSLLDSVIDSLTFETSPSERDLLGRWYWLRSTYNNDTDLLVDVPSRYTVEFKADGTLDIRADCNLLSWTYIREANSLTINALGTTTLAECPLDSLDEQFLQDLSEVASYVMHEGNLVLNLRADAGNMIFGK